MSQRLKSAFLWLVGLSVLFNPLDAHAQQKSGTTADSTVASPLVLIRHGGCETVLLVWDSGTGRVPVVVLSTEPTLTRPQRNASPSASHAAGGITLLDDQEAANAIQKQIVTTKQTSSKVKQRRTIRAVKISVASDAEIGLHERFVHVVSGTGRTMVLSARIQVLVSGA